MNWFIPVGLILLGWLLLFLEILFIPGVAVLVIIGITLVMTGIYYSFAHFGTEAGLYTIAGTLLLIVGSLVITFRAGFWKKLSLKDTNDSQMNTIDKHVVQPGYSAKAISRIAPSGKALIGDSVYEVHSEEGYISENSQLEIVKISGNKIFVKLKTS